MKIVSQEKIKLRSQYQREMNQLYIDDLTKYTEWLEVKLALMIIRTEGKED